MRNILTFIFDVKLAKNTIYYSS